MSADSKASLDPQFLAAVSVHTPSRRVRAQAEAAGIDLESLRENDPLTYAAINAAALIRTDARLAPQVNAALTQVAPHAQLFTVPLTNSQTDTELRVFPTLGKAGLDVLDNALGTFVGTQPGGLFYRTVGDVAGEHRELAWPLSPQKWQAGTALVGPFSDEAAANIWGRDQIDPRAGFVFDALPYAGAWYCDVFKGE